MCVEQMRDSLDNDKTVFETIAVGALTPDSSLFFALA